MRETEKKTFFRKKDLKFYNLLPYANAGLVLETQEHDLLEEQLKQILTDSRNVLRQLLNGFEKLCNLEQAFNDWQSFSFPTSAKGFEAFIALDYYSYYLRLPSEKQYLQLVDDAVYRQYLFGRHLSFLQTIATNVILANVIEHLQPDEYLLKKQLAEYIGFCSIRIPLKDTWYLETAQNAAMAIMEKIDASCPVIIVLIDGNAHFDQRTLIVTGYQKINHFTLQVHVTTSQGIIRKLQLHFDGRFYVEEFTENSSLPTTTYKTMVVLDVVAVQPPTRCFRAALSNWLVSHPKLAILLMR
jgi:hypothetical protein